MDNSQFKDRIIGIEKRRVGDIGLNPRNPKRYTAQKSERLEAALSQFGKVGVLFTYFDDNGFERFFDGNTRKQINDDEIWTVAQTDLTQEEVDSLVMVYDPLAAPDWEADLARQLMAETAVTDDSLTDMLKEIETAVNAEAAAKREQELDVIRQRRRQDVTRQLTAVSANLTTLQHRFVIELLSQVGKQNLTAAYLAAGGTAKDPAKSAYQIRNKKAVVEAIDTYFANAGGMAAQTAVRLMSEKAEFDPLQYARFTYDSNGRLLDLWIDLEAIKEDGLGHMYKGHGYAADGRMIPEFEGNLKPLENIMRMYGKFKDHVSIDIDLSQYSDEELNALDKSL